MENILDALLPEKDEFHAHSHDEDGRKTQQAPRRRSPIFQGFSALLWSS